jgi:hypothetical protein
MYFNYRPDSITRPPSAPFSAGGDDTTRPAGVNDISNVAIQYITMSDLIRRVNATGNGQLALAAWSSGAVPACGVLGREIESRRCISWYF